MTLKEAVVKTIKPQKLTQKDRKFLDSVVNGNWIQNSKTGLIDVKGDVWLDNKNLTKIPYKFGRVTRNFYCHNNQLTSLEGCPEYVEGDFYCHNNQLTSLKYCPKVVKGYFYCDGNQLQSLKYCPKVVNGYFYCHGNQLQSSKYLPLMIANYDQCIKEINLQKTEYLIDMGFDPKQRKLFKQLMDELDK